MHSIMFSILLMVLLCTSLYSNASTRTIAWDYPGAAVLQATTPTVPSHGGQETPAASKREVQQAVAASTFVIQRRLDGVWTDVGTVPGQTGSDIRYTDTTLPDRASDYQVVYRVLAKVGAETSPASNELTLTVLAIQAVKGTFYMALTGSDANTCAQAQQAATPKATLASLLPCAAGGSKIYLRQGIYEQTLDTAKVPIRGGTSWDTATLLASYPGETATLRLTPAGGNVLAFFQAPTTDPYVVLDRLTLDANKMPGSNTLVCRNGTKNVRFQGGKLLNSYYETVFIAGGSGCEVLNSEITGNSVLAAVGLEDTQNVRLEGNNIHDTAGHGIAWSNERPNTAVSIARNRFTRVGDTAVVLGGTWSAVNNVISGGKVGVRVARGSSNVPLAYNTITGMSGAGIAIDSGVTGTALTNDILYGNGQPLSDSGSGTVQLTNLITDPLFVDAPAGDFRLKQGSPARDTGTLMAQVTTDLTGTARPQGPGVDIGAYEAAPGETPEPPVPPEPPIPPPDSLIWHCEVQAPDALTRIMKCIKKP